MSCSICLETSQVSLRKCCNVYFCDYCYTIDKICPSCKEATKVEKSTGLVYAIAMNSEFEECRICLNPGLKRRCCGNYYCDDCFNSQIKCRSCGTDIATKFETRVDRKTPFIPFVIGWIISTFIAMIMISLIIVISLSESVTPIGIFNFKCFGFYSKCDSFYCKNMNVSTALGLSPLPELLLWDSCSLSSVAKLESFGCVFDQQLYEATNQKLGYDICVKNFTNNLIIFEDTFENWVGNSLSNNKMLSANWEYVSNGKASEDCGFANTILGGHKALSFSGAMSRFIETKPLDLVSGGIIEFDLLISPEGFDTSHPNCKTAFSSYITVDYSIDQGLSWVSLSKFDAYKFRSDSFQHNTIHIPLAAATSNTKIRVFQGNFEATRDGWAIDNFQIFLNLPSDWHSNSQFNSNLDDTIKDMTIAQCCYDTDWCLQRFTPQKRISECLKYPWYDNVAINPNHYNIRLSELFILICFIVNITKFIYVSFREWFMKARIPFQDEFKNILSISWIDYLIPDDYKPKKLLKDITGNVHLSARVGKNIESIFKEDEKIHGIRDESREKIDSIYSNFSRASSRRSSKIVPLSRSVSIRNLAEPSDLVSLDESKTLESAFSTDENATKASHETKSSRKLKKQEQKLLQNHFDIEIFKKKNVMATRIPIEYNVSQWFTKSFGIFVITIFLGILYALYSIREYSYTLIQRFEVFGFLKSNLVITSDLIILFAIFCDTKEIYYTLKNVVPLSSKFLPYVTVDINNDSKALYIGENIISLVNIKDFTPITKMSIIFSAVSYFFGCLPWCLLSLIIREFVNFEVMRYITSIFGILMIARAVLGSGFCIKMFFTLKLLFEIDSFSRDSIGISIQSRKNVLSVSISSIFFGLLSLLISSFIDLAFIGQAFGIGLLFGLIYGFTNGFYHSIPLRPWMFLTTIDNGVYFSIKKLEKCQFSYGGNCCTEINTYEEMLILFTTDDMYFLSLLNNGSRNI